MEDKIIQVSGFGVENTHQTQTYYMLVALTESGKVFMNHGGSSWIDISPPDDKESRLLSLYRKKRSVDGLNGRTWDAVKNHKYDAAIAALEGWYENKADTIPD